MKATEWIGMIESHTCRVQLPFVMWFQNPILMRNSWLPLITAVSDCLTCVKTENNKTKQAEGRADISAVWTQLLNLKWTVTSDQRYSSYWLSTRDIFCVISEEKKNQ